MAELFKLPTGLQLHCGGRKVWRDLAPRKVVEIHLPAIVAGAAKLKGHIEVAKARLSKMPNETDIEKKVYGAHEVKAKQMEVDLVDFEALISSVPAEAPKPKVKAKK